jgi:hypothetical protein
MDAYHQTVIELFSGSFWRCSQRAIVALWARNLTGMYRETKKQTEVRE